MGSATKVPARLAKVHHSSVAPRPRRKRRCAALRTIIAAGGTKGSRHTPMRGPAALYRPIMKVVAAASEENASSAHRSSKRMGVARAAATGSSAPSTWKPLTCANTNGWRRWAIKKSTTPLAVSSPNVTSCAAVRPCSATMSGTGEAGGSNRVRFDGGRCASSSLRAGRETASSTGL